MGKTSLNCGDQQDLKNFSFLVRSTWNKMIWLIWRFSLAAFIERILKTSQISSICVTVHLSLIRFLSHILFLGWSLHLSFLHFSRSNATIRSEVIFHRTKTQQDKCYQKKKPPPGVLKMVFSIAKDLWAWRALKMKSRVCWKVVCWKFLNLSNPFIC